ncbi:hypothetical protein EDC14_103612 [Hydrogenispora ethanolica]|uniref:Phosphate transport regulator n=1 Tax=Hydrogenispora ethanolica TaxID=1082276 RepID=A0A4R1R4D4_HYDET|nr:DUF47 family protein [Hydrogenispora ethanolica]TCL60260.1 hypothetical protein EDC14_103612 [Hydrogenispora ethanolica]
MFGERDSRFFHLFETAATNVSNASQVLLAIATSPQERCPKTEELEKLEHCGDELTHDIISELHHAFITPIDREDIFLIAKETDNIIDSMEAAAHRFVMFNISETTPAAQRLAQLINESSKVLVSIMHELRKIKHIVVDNKLVVEINRLENEGDIVYREAVKELYSGAYDALTVVKWREIYDHLEGTLDALEDVANIVEGIAMKHT